LQQRDIGRFRRIIVARGRKPAGQGQLIGRFYTLTSSNAFGLAGWLDAVAGLVTVTEITSPFAAVTVVVTVPSGAVVTVVVSAEADDDGEDEAPPAELNRLRAVAAPLPTAPMVMMGLLKFAASLGIDWLTSDLRLDMRLRGKRNYPPSIRGVS